MQFDLINASSDELPSANSCQVQRLPVVELIVSMSPGLEAATKGDYRRHGEVSACVIVIDAVEKASCKSSLLGGRQ